MDGLSLESLSLSVPLSRLKETLQSTITHQQQSYLTNLLLYSGEK